MHPNAVNAYQTYLLRSSQFQRTTKPVGAVVPRYAILEADEEPLFPMLETARIYCGLPSVLKNFYEVVFEGQGTLYVRAIVDGKEAGRGWVSMDPGPRQSQVFRLPEGTAGLWIVLQLGGLGVWEDAQLMWEA